MGGGGCFTNRDPRERQRQRQRRCATPGKESIGSESKKEKRLRRERGQGDTQRPQERGREGRASVLRNPAPGDPGRTLPPPAKAPGAFPGSLVPFLRRLGKSAGVGGTGSRHGPEYAGPGLPGLGIRDPTKRTGESGRFPSCLRSSLRADPNPALRLSWPAAPPGDGRPDLRSPLALPPVGQRVACCWPRG